MEIKNGLRKQSFVWGDFLIIGSMLIMFSFTIYKLYSHEWRTADYTHAYFILPISSYLIFRQRKHLKRNDKITVGGVSLFVLGIFIYIFSIMNEFLFLESASFVIMMWAVFSLKIEKESFKKLQFPLGYLVFMIRPPSLAIDLITLPLKKISTSGSYFLLKLFRLPVEVHGAILKVGGHELFITDACSGFRSIVTLLALGAVYAYAQNTSLLKKWIIFISVIPLGILGNILRITITGCIAYFGDIKYAEGFFHGFSGAILFVVTVAGLMGVTELLTHEG